MLEASLQHGGPGCGRAGAVLLLALLLAGCAAGPRYQPPPAPAVARYAPEPVAAEFNPDTPVDPRWWRNFASAPLDDLVAESLHHNSDLKMAEETLEVARAELAASRSVLFPQIDLALAGSRQRPSAAMPGAVPNAYDLYTGQVRVGYDPGLFGLNSSLVASARARLAIADSQLAAARLLVAGNVVQTALQLAALTGQMQAMQQAVADEAAVLALVQTQYRLGAIDRSAVLTQQSLLASSRAQLTELAQARDATRHLLATYLGRFPADSADLPVPDFASLTLPAELPLSLPSALVTARPDIRAAEAALRGANAEVGAAVARLFPQLRLDAGWGAAANSPGDALLSVNRLWDVTGAILAPIFAGGRLRAERRAAEANYRRLLASYRGTVLDAFRDVADVLRALAHDSQLVQVRAAAARSADAALALETARYRAGGSEYLRVLTTQVQAAQARIALIAAQRQQFGDTAALYVALGGGDWAAGTGAAAADPPTMMDGN